jgi:hypothetical protein
MADLASRVCAAGTTRIHLTALQVIGIQDKFNKAMYNCRLGFNTNWCTRKDYFVVKWF